MTHRTRPVLDHVWFVQIVLLVAALAFVIQGLERNSVMETILNYLTETFQCQCTVNHESRIVTFPAIIPEVRVRARYWPCDEEFLRTSLLVNGNGDNCPGYDNRADQETGNTQPVYLAIIGEIILVALGDLLLRAARLRHARVNSETASQKRARLSSEPIGKTVAHERKASRVTNVGSVFADRGCGVHGTSLQSPRLARDTD